MVLWTLVNPLFIRIKWPEPSRAESGCKLEPGCDDVSAASRDLSVVCEDSLETLLAAKQKHQRL